MNSDDRLVPNIEKADLVLGGTLVFGGLQALEGAPDDPPSPDPSP